MTRNALFVLLLLLTAPGAFAPSVHSAAQPPQAAAAPRAPAAPATESPLHEPDALHDLQVALVRLPLAAVLGAALAMRPKRRGTPPRTPAVLQTQIILSIVGAVIMLVVGSSLARAFGIVGAANLIRYRSKIDDPKDAVVMLCTLSVGLAAGVGLYVLAVVSTIFIGGALWVIESFENPVKRFDLKVKIGKDTDDAAAEDRSRSSSGSSWSSSFAPRRTRRSATMSRCRSRCRPIACPTPSSASTPRATRAVDWSEKKNKAK